MRCDAQRRQALKDWLNIPRRDEEKGFDQLQAEREERRRRGARAMSPTRLNFRQVSEATHLLATVRIETCAQEDMIFESAEQHLFRTVRIETCAGVSLTHLNVAAVR